ncbi:MAG: protein-L-isoaspartate O-methyltransferase [Methanoculleus sp. SDB]|nr:MAG: protein-L-isoaspartate O-methyltransferase [Methanoculleus sp. SDB]
MDDERSAVLRERMVRDQIEGRGISDRRVLAAMRAIPRHVFVPEEVCASAYEDRPLPIGEGQTISQPYIVALMTELLDVGPEDRVLEIGAGSGYQAAILGRIASHVISVERLPAIARGAREHLAALGIDNVEVVVGDGTAGWPAEAPYDAIIVTAAAPDIPRPLLDQLRDGGRLVAPVGDRAIQTLVRLEKAGGELSTRSCGGVCFVPLIGEYGWHD